MQATSQSCQPAVAVELFCGMGGLSLGIEQVGFDVGLAVEKDETTYQSYRKNFPHTSVLRAEIAKLTGDRIRALVVEHYQVRSRFVGWKDYCLFLDLFKFYSTKWRDIARAEMSCVLICTSGGKSSYGSY